MTSAWRNVEISDPRFERDGLRCLTFASPALGRRGDVTIWTPPDARREAATLPMVVLLHGVYGSHWAWALKGGAHRVAHALIEAGEIRPMALAMPSDGLWGDGSGYVARDGADHERWIVDDVIGCARDVIDGLGPESPVCLCGLSMGGWGAMWLGARHADRVRAVSAHSSVTNRKDLQTFVEDDWSGFTPSDGGPMDLAPRLIDRAADLPPLRFDCGVDDPLIESNRRLHRALEAAGVAHAYEEFPGEHTWEYWEEHLEDSLRFFEDRL